MKVIADDEEDSSIILGGGECDNYTRDEYVNWCYGIVQARKDSNKEQEKDFSDKLLCALKAFCLRKIDDIADSEKETIRLKEEGYSDDKIPSMLYTPEDIAVMKGEIEEIWNSIDPAEDNYIQKVNIVSVQCSNMFTHHVKNKLNPRGQEFDIELIINYKNYNDTKKEVSKDTEYSGYLINNGVSVFYLISVEPLFVSHILDGFLEHNIWFLGFETRFLNIDGNNWQSPFSFTSHDLGHANGSLSMCYRRIYGSNDNTEKGYESVSNFYKYCKEKYKKGSKELSALQLAIFYVIHEIPHNCNIWFGNSSWGGFEKSILIKPYMFLDENALFGILPKRIRQSTEADPSKKEELVTNYLKNEVIENFVNTYTSWKRERGITPTPEQPTTVGGRKTKRRRSKKTIKKRRKSRKSRK
jgi:hypothetical protein